MITNKNTLCLYHCLSNTETNTELSLVTQAEQEEEKITCKLSLSAPSLEGGKSAVMGTTGDVRKHPQMPGGTFNSNKKESSNELHCSNPVFGNFFWIQIL